MQRINKAFNIVVIFTLIGVFLCAQVVRGDTLRVPIGKTPERIEGLLRSYVTPKGVTLEIRFPEKGDIEALCEAHNEAWENNEKLQLTPSIVSLKLERDPRSCLIIETPDRGIVGVLWIARLKTGGDLMSIGPGDLWERVAERPSEEGADTLVCYAVGVIHEVRRDRDLAVAKSLIDEAKAIAREEGLGTVCTLSPAPRFKRFREEYGETLAKMGIPEELWIYAYLVSVEGQGPTPYLEYIKEHGYISIGDFIIEGKKRLYCPVEGVHVAGRGATLGVALRNARPDYEYSVMYVHASPEDHSRVYSAGVTEKMRKLLGYYIKSDNTLEAGLAEKIKSLDLKGVRSLVKQYLSHRGHPERIELSKGIADETRGLTWFLIEDLLPEEPMEDIDVGILVYDMYQKILAEALKGFIEEDIMKVLTRLESDDSQHAWVLRLPVARETFEAIISNSNERALEVYETIEGEKILLITKGPDRRLIDSRFERALATCTTLGFSLEEGHSHPINESTLPLLEDEGEGVDTQNAMERWKLYRRPSFIASLVNRKLNLAIFDGAWREYLDMEAWRKLQEMRIIRIDPDDTRGPDPRPRLDGGIVDTLSRIISETSL